jgi:AraC-like DNA-binding protein
MSFLVDNRAIRPMLADSSAWFQVSVVYYGIANMPASLNRSRYQNPFWLIYRHLDPGGEMRHESGAVTEIRTCDVVVLPPWQTWQIATHRTLRHIFIVVDAPLLSASLVRKHFYGAQVMPQGRTWREVGQAMEAVAREVEVQSTPSHLTACRLQGLSCRVFEHLLTPLSQFAAHPEPVRTMVEHIDQHLGGDCRLTTLSRLAGVGVKRLNHAFQAAIGVTAVEYVRERRLALSANLLLTSAWSLDRIAAEVGFPNRHYFSRVFARSMGRPPARYRQEHVAR